MRTDNRSIELPFTLWDMTIGALVVVELHATRVVLPGLEVDIVVAGRAGRIMRARVILRGLRGLLVARCALANVPREGDARKVFHPDFVTGELVFPARFHTRKVRPVVDLVDHHSHV